MKINGQLKKVNARSGMRLDALIILSGAIAALLLFWFIAHQMVNNELHWDEKIFTEITSLRNDSLTAVMKAVTWFGSSYFLFPAYTILATWFLFIKKNKKLAFDIVAIGITGRVLLQTMKYIFQRQRPADPLTEQLATFSFPSGHAFSSFTFFGVLAYIFFTSDLKPVWKWALLILCISIAAAVSFSRIYLKVHYPSDIIAGFCLCLVWLTISFSLLNRINRNK